MKKKFHPRWLLGSLLWLLASTCWGSYVYDPVNGNVYIDQTNVQAGTVLNVTLQSPMNSQFISNFRVTKDPVLPLDQTAFYISNMFASYNVDLSTLPPGTPFSFTIDTLNYEPGEYYFYTFPIGTSNFVYSHVTITAPDPTIPAKIRTNMLVNNLQFGLYGATGGLISYDPNISGAVITQGTAKKVPLKRDNVYTLAVNLSNLSAFNNTISLNYYDSAGVTLLYANMLSFRVVRTAAFDQGMQVDPACTGTPVNLAAYPAGIATITFRAPPHLKFYKNTGVVKMTLNAAKAGQGCSPTASTIQIPLDDSAAAVPIPLWVNQPDIVANRMVRFVRFGNYKLTSLAELQTYAQAVSDNFFVATKQYFSLSVAGVHSFSLVQPNINQQKVTNWYNSLPKTPGKAVLNLNDPDELYLATLLYYYESGNGAAQLEADMQAAYPQQSNGEDITIYVNDGDNVLGQGMGNHAARVKVLRLYPGYVFYTNTTPRTYHFDLASCNFCGGTAQGLIQSLVNESNQTAVINTTLHELGHIGWLAEVNVSTGDLQTQFLPYQKSPVYKDDSLGYFTRFEYMSYGRDRTTLQNMTYGDAYLERILSKYLTCTGYYQNCNFLLK